MKKALFIVSALILVLSLILQVAFPAPVLAAGVHYPGTVSTNSEGLYVDQDWSTPGLVNAVGGGSAGVSLATLEYSYILRATNYGFSIPASNTIKGIQVEIERQCPTGGARAAVIQLTKDGSTRVGANKGSPYGTWDWPGSSTTIFGGTTDLWGTTWTPAEINSSTFGVHLAAQAYDLGSANISADYIRIMVYYEDPTAKMYVTNFLGGTISKANLDGTGGVGLIVNTLNYPGDIALDLSAGKMYVPTTINNTISQANLDGSGGVSLGNLNLTLNMPTGIALDLTAGKMYVTNRDINSISQANLNGSGGLSLGNLGGTLNMPTGIALDLTGGKMYVTNSANNTISQANLNGSGGLSLGNLGGTLNGPMAIALDLSAGKMYIANYNNNTISQANLNGSGGVSLGNLGGTLNNPRGIALDLTAGKMYVTNSISPDSYGDIGIISQADLDGTNGVSLGNLNGTINGAWGIALGALQDEEEASDLAITKTDSPDPVAPGGDLTYTIVVTNNGPSDAHNIIVTETLPSNLTFISADTHGWGTYNGITGIWSGFDLIYEHTGPAILTIVYRVESTVTDGTVLTNTVEVNGDEPDPNPDNNAATQNTNVRIPKGVGGEVQAVNKSNVITPWLILALGILIGASVLVIRRRKVS